MRYFIWLLTIGLYSPVLYQLYRSRWETIDYTHAYFILPISLWLAWRARKELTATSSPGGSWGLGLVLLGLAMFVFGWRLDYLSVSAISAIPLLFGIVLYLYGTGPATKLSFPILYLLLLVPPPLGVLDSITVPMRHGISVLTEIILKTAGYPITRDGLMMVLGGHDIYMGAPCSGFRSLITFFSLGLVYAYISKTTPLKKAILVGAIIPLALVGNLVRVIVLCLITYYFGEKVGQGFFHGFSGMVIFLILITGLIGLEKLMDRR